MVQVIVRDLDRYDRTVADVRLPDGRSLNHEVVRGGYAWWFRRYSSDASLATAESEVAGPRRDATRKRRERIGGRQPTEPHLSPTRLSRLRLRWPSESRPVWKRGGGRGRGISARAELSVARDSLGWRVLNAVE